MSAYIVTKKGSYFEMKQKSLFRKISVHTLTGIWATKCPTWEMQLMKCIMTNTKGNSISILQAAIKTCIYIWTQYRSDKIHYDTLYLQLPAINETPAEFPFFGFRNNLKPYAPSCNIWYLWLEAQMHGINLQGKYYGPNKIMVKVWALYISMLTH